jgi:hypothetical protein
MLGICHAGHVAPLHPQKLPITSPTSGGRSVGIVRSRTQAMELVTLYFCKIFLLNSIQYGTGEEKYISDFQCSLYFFKIFLILTSFI